MLPRTYSGQNCSIARTLEVVGDRWTLLVIRDAFLGLRRFDDFHENLGVARNVLTDRLGRLVEEDILERRRYQERPERFEYRLTQRGEDLWPTLVTLMHWGDRHLTGEEGAPLLLVHRGCGGPISDRRVCETCLEEVGPRQVTPVAGPGASPPLRERLDRLFPSVAVPSG